MDRAISASLIINALVSNALKHAFPDGRTDRVRVELRALQAERCVLAVMDDGIGLPADLATGHADPLGLRLAYDLTHQLHGTIHVLRDGGTTFIMSFDADARAETSR